MIVAGAQVALSIAEGIMSVIHWPKEVPAIVESVEARDRRDCVALYQKADSADREWAQWCLDNPSYTHAEIARWCGCGTTTVKRKRKWAKAGFVGLWSDIDRGPERPHAVDETLKTHDNFEDDEMEPSDDVEDPTTILWHLLDTIQGQKAVAEAYRKIFKKSSFDRETKAKIYNEIQQLIVKWRTVQSTLDTKGQGNG
jgi:hypothetical protein